MGSADQLTCRSCRRYKDDTFFCSDWHIQDHFLTRHCDFGFTYYAPQRTLEIVRGLVEQPSIRSGILGMYRRGLENYSPADCGSRLPKPELPSLFRDEKKARQWKILRKLRRNFKLFHQWFLKMCKSSDQPDVRRFARRKYRHWKDVFNTLILTLRKILRNHPPASLAEVFAFIALSCALKKINSKKFNEPPCPPHSYGNVQGDI
jgi:hypothetical protein